jgi:hypothetical protein
VKAGNVVSIRVNPRDCQSVLDVCERVGIDTRGQSFSQLTSLALSSLLETARVNSVLPEPDPFQYLNRMAGFTAQNGRNTKKKHAAILVQERMGSDLRVPALSAPVADRGLPVNTSSLAASASQSPAAIQSTEAPPAVEYSEEEVERAGERLTELLQIQDDRELTDAEQKLFDAYYKIVYPQG